GASCSRCRPWPHYSSALNRGAGAVGARRRPWATGGLFWGGISVEFYATQCAALSKHFTRPSPASLYLTSVDRDRGAVWFGARMADVQGKPRRSVQGCCFLKVRGARHPEP